MPSDATVMVKLHGPVTALMQFYPELQTLANRFGVGVSNPLEEVVPPRNTGALAVETVGRPMTLGISFDLGPAGDLVDRTNPDNPKPAGGTTYPAIEEILPGKGPTATGRVRETLRRNGVTTVAKILELGSKGLQNLPQVGPHSVEIIQEQFARHGIPLPESRTRPTLTAPTGEPLEQLMRDKIKQLGQIEEMLDARASSAPTEGKPSAPQSVRHQRAPKQRRPRNIRNLFPNGGTVATRMIHRLENEDITTVKRLLEHTDTELMDIPGIGPGAITLLNDALAPYGAQILEGEE